jgi:hypothetical protein
LVGKGIFKEAEPLCFGEAGVEDCHQVGKVLEDFGEVFVDGVG